MLPSLPWSCGRLPTLSPLAACTASCLFPFAQPACHPTAAGSALIPAYPVPTPAPENCAMPCFDQLRHYPSTHDLMPICLRCTSMPFSLASYAPTAYVASAPTPPTALPALQPNEPLTSWIGFHGEMSAPARQAGPFYFAAAISFPPRATCGGMPPSVLHYKPAHAPVLQLLCLHCVQCNFKATSKLRDRVDGQTATPD